MSTKTSNLKNNDTSFIDDDEIDLVELFKTLWENKKTIIATALLFAITTGIISFMLPKQYKSTASFFITESDKPSNSLMGYAAMLGVSTPGNIESLINNVLESYSIKVNIAEKYHQNFDDAIKEYKASAKYPITPAHVNNFIIKRLKLDTNFSFSINKNSLFELKYISEDKIQSKLILDHYLNNIIEYNKSLELSAEKNIITIVDPPQPPLYKFKPNIKLNIIIGGILGGFLSVIFVTIRSYLFRNNKLLKNIN
jgi:uncharacterized protein involved in exopolysaccharide biosynthesis